MICQGLVHRSGRRGGLAGGQDALRGRDARGSSQKSIFPSPVLSVFPTFCVQRHHKRGYRSKWRRRRRGVVSPLLGARGCCHGGDFVRRNWDNAPRGLRYPAVAGSRRGQSFKKRNKKFNGNALKKKSTSRIRVRVSQPLTRVNPYRVNSL